MIMISVDKNRIGDEIQYNKIVRKFSLDKMLRRVNKESAAIMMSHKQGDPFGCRSVSFVSYEGKPFISKRSKANHYLVKAWELIDLSYHAILYSNDYRGSDPAESDDVFYAVVSLAAAYYQEQERELIEGFDDQKNDIYLFLWGFAGEQFRIQIPQRVFENAKRELYILFESSKRVDNPINISSIVRERVGVEWQKVITALLFAWQASTENVIISDVGRRISINETALSEDEFQTVLNYYTANYSDVRNSEVGRQYLYLKPYIRTSRNKTISVNCYLSLFAYENSIYWIVRDYYRDLDSREFTSMFGKYFETYFQELMETYLDANEYTKIPEVEGAKRADWKLNLNGYNILVEQKSSLLGLLSKQQYSDIEAIKNYGISSIIHALEQLKITEAALDDGKYIKIVLVYENYLSSMILENIFKLDNCDIENDYYYWMVTIEEMEQLLYLYHTDEDGFKKVMEEKIKREVEQSNLGRAIGQLLSLVDLEDNPYLKLQKFDYYGSFVFS